MALHVVLGTGAIGSHLAPHLIERGHQVRVVNRSGNRGSLPAGAELMSGDLTNPAFASAALKDAAVTYHVTMPPYHRWLEEFVPLQDSIIRAAGDAGSRLVVGDNLYAYGDHQGAAISESSEQRAGTRKGALRKRMAADALAAHARGDVELTLVQPSNYFGPHYAVMQDLVVGAALAGKTMRWMGRVDLQHSYSYVVDVARAMVDLGESQVAWGKTWIPPVFTASPREISQVVWEKAGRSGSAKVQGLRGAMLKMIALTNPAVKETVEMMYEFDQPFHVDSSAFEREFGWAASPLDEIARASVAARR